MYRLSKISAACLTIAVVGCSHGESTTSASRVQADVATPSHRWQYKAVETDMVNVQDAKAVQKALDENNADGWEFVSATDQVLIFRRPQ
jgi:hypothetical protein